MKELNVGFIGTGWTERVQIDMYTMAGLRPYAVSSRKVENAKRVASKFGMPKYYTDWKELVEDPAVDVVSIVTPSYLHFEMAKYAVENHKHVVCQAPFMNTSEIEALMAIKQNYPDKLFIVDFELRFTPARQSLKKHLQDNLIGEIFAADFTYKKNYALDKESEWLWEHDKSLGGGMLNIVGDALIDLSNFYFGKAEDVFASTYTYCKQRITHSGELKAVTADDFCHVKLTSEEGVNVDIIASAVHAENEGMTIEVRGSTGMLKLDTDDSLWYFRNDEEEWKQLEVDDQLPTDFPNDLRDYPYAVGTYYFAKSLVNAIQNNHPLDKACTLEEALEMQQILDAANQSVISKKTINLLSHELSH